MKRFILASVLTLSTLGFTLPAMAQLPAPLPKAQSSFTSGSLHVDVYGTPGKPALVFIPGMTCGPWEWSGEINAFAPNYTIYALTLPGFDGQPAAKPPLFQTVTSDFWSMLQTHNIAKPVVVGHSLGGTLGILLAEQHSDRLRGVVAVEGLPVLPGFEKMPPAQRQAMATRMGGMLSAITSPAQFEAAEKTYVLPYMITSAQDVDAVAALVARSDPKATAAWQEEDMLGDTRADLSKISVPLLEIAPFDATLDPKMPGGTLKTAADKQQYYASLLAGDPTAKVEMVNNSRHFVMYDQPAALHSDIAAFLNSL